MAEPSMVGCSYFSSAFTYTNGELAEDMRHTLAGVKYDTIIGTGLSGTVFTARVAPALRKVFAILRKPDDESTHSGNRLEGRVGDSWVFADDFSETGATLLRVVKYMQKNHPNCEFKGMYSYERGIFRDPEELQDRFHYNEELYNTLMGPIQGPRKPSMFDPAPLSEPVGGWPPEMKALVPIPHDAEVSYDTPDGQPTFWSRSTGRSYVASEYPQFKEVSELVLKARQTGLTRYDLFYRRWSDLYARIPELQADLKRAASSKVPQWDVATGEIVAP